MYSHFVIQERDEWMDEWEAYIITICLIRLRRSYPAITITKKAGMLHSNGHYNLTYIPYEGSILSTWEIVIFFYVEWLYFLLWLCILNLGTGCTTCKLLWTVFDPPFIFTSCGLCLNCKLKTALWQASIQGSPQQSSPIMPSVQQFRCFLQTLLKRSLECLASVPVSHIEYFWNMDCIILMWPSLQWYLWQRIMCIHFG